VAVVFQDASITYRELDALTNRFARALAALCIRGPQIMQGYWKAPEATAAALRGGSYYSGDIGCVDERGYLYIATARRK
jgi:acyl-CoA synthetase (AMP-forming)/AMP-acid ligase II